VLGMTKSALRMAVYRGTIPCVRVGRRLRFRPSELVTR
jgi:excisionase family DNA binding protein